jgi:hypothetical protein
MSPKPNESPDDVPLEGEAEPHTVWAETLDDFPDNSPQPASLVPVHGVEPGIQAYRRGELILYTVRGEPDQVRELIGKLDEAGVSEVIALISHPAGPRDESEPDGDTAEDD